MTIPDEAVQADTHSTAARLNRLLKVCHGLRWTDVGVLALENESTKKALGDLSEILFMDGIDEVVSGKSTTAALPFLTGLKVKERVFVVSALAQSKDKTGWRSRIIGAANLDEAVGKGLRAFEASEPSVSFCVPGGIEISNETLATAGILSATDVSAPIPSPRAQALEEAALERSIERWRGMKPSEVMKGSTAQITYALVDARKDILTLYSALSSQPVADECSAKSMTGYVSERDADTIRDGGKWAILVHCNQTEIYSAPVTVALPTPPEASEYRSDAEGDFAEHFGLSTCPTGGSDHGE